MFLLRAPHEGCAGEARLLHHPNAYIFYDVECDRSDSARLYSVPVLYRSPPSMSTRLFFLLTNLLAVQLYALFSELQLYI